MEGEGIVPVLRYLGRSKAAVLILLLCLGLVLAELTSQGFRRSFTEKYPFTVGLLSGLLFVVFGAVAVDLYLKEREEQRRELERQREREAWDPVAKRIFDEVYGSFSASTLVISSASLSLLEAGPRGEVGDLAGIAAPVAQAAKPIREVLSQRLAVMLLRPELTEAAGKADEIAEAFETAAHIIASWDFTKPNRTSLEAAESFVTARQQWFFERQMEATDKHIAEIDRHISAGPSVPPGHQARSPHR